MNRGSEIPSLDHADSAGAPSLESKDLRLLQTGILQNGFEKAVTGLVSLDLARAGYNSLKKLLVGERKPE